MNEKEDLLKRTLQDLGKIYPVGLYEYLYRHRREAYNELQRLEDRIDKASLFGTVEELKAVLREYWRLHIQAIREFKQVDPASFNLPIARHELEEERIRA